MKVAWAHVALFPRRDCQLTILIVLDDLSPLLHNFTLCKKISQTQSLTIVTHHHLWIFTSYFLSIVSFGNIKVISAFCALHRTRKWMLYLQGS